MQGNSRKITNTGGKKIIGSFASQKMGTMIRWESQLERDYIYHIELDPNVISYVSQPTGITYRDCNGKILNYTPDFWVQRSDCEEMVEVKPKEKTIESEFLEKIKSIQKELAIKGYKYVIKTEEDILGEPRLSNLKYLYRYARFEADVVKRELCLRYFKENKNAIIKDIINDLSDKGIGIEIIFQLIGKGDLVVDMDKKLNKESCVQMHP